MMASRVAASGSTSAPLLNSNEKFSMNRIPCRGARYRLTVVTCSSTQQQVSSDLTKNEEHIKIMHLDGAHCRRGFVILPLISAGIAMSSPALAKGKNKSKFDENRLLEQNRKIQAANNVPEDFPNFIREGFEVKVVTSEKYVKCDSGLLYLDIAAGQGDCPTDGQQVTFHYIGYNESGRRIDSTYIQGSPAKIRMGTKVLVPGFEEGIRDMRPGGRRRIIIPPELGPPVGPSTFFSAKQFEVFDVELLGVKDCQRRTIGFYSDFVCE
ncbi:FKBP-like peptidyl-prolyl cis-trans isomerase family protein [Wolffia australiana]